MLVRQSDSDQTLPLTPASSFGHPDMVALDMAVSIGQTLVTSQVSTQMKVNISTIVPNPLTTFTSTNQGTGGHFTHHEWVWSWLEGQAGGSLDPAHTECWSITLVVHQELRVMPLRIQWLTYWDMLIEFDDEVNMKWVVKNLLKMECWIRASCQLKCIPCSDEDGLQQFRGGEWVSLRVDPECMDQSRHGQLTPTGPVVWAQPDDYWVPLFLEVLQNK